MEVVVPVVGGNNESARRYKLWTNNHKTSISPLFSTLGTPVNTTAIRLRGAGPGGQVALCRPRWLLPTSNCWCAVTLSVISRLPDCLHECLVAKHIVTHTALVSHFVFSFWSRVSQSHSEGEGNICQKATQASCDNGNLLESEIRKHYNETYQEAVSKPLWHCCHLKINKSVENSQHRGLHRPRGPGFTHSNFSLAWSRKCKMEVDKCRVVSTVFNGCWRMRQGAEGRGLKQCNTLTTWTEHFSWENVFKEGCK